MCGIIIVGQGVAQVIISIQEELNMENCKLLNLKNMKETIVNYSGDQKEFDKNMGCFLPDGLYRLYQSGYLDKVL